jgi:hypothetical protein
LQDAENLCAKKISHLLLQLKPVQGHPRWVSIEQRPYFSRDITIDLRSCHLSISNHACASGDAGHWALRPSWRQPAIRNWLCWGRGRVLRHSGFGVNGLRALPLRPSLLYKEQRRTRAQRATGVQLWEALGLVSLWPFLVALAMGPVRAPAVCPWWAPPYLEGTADRV